MLKTRITFLLVDYKTSSYYQGAGQLGILWRIQKEGSFCIPEHLRDLVIEKIQMASEGLRERLNVKSFIIFTHL